MKKGQRKQAPSNTVIRPAGTSAPMGRLIGAQRGPRATTPKAEPHAKMISALKGMGLSHEEAHEWMRENKGVAYK